jgi:hypothetical protein|tara:strand:- start:5123 stop:5353 length:231 start_codon:yes stop_codon:yes gene_type:complete
MINQRNCKKCKHLCHCIEADHEGCQCSGCECSSKEYFRHFDKKTEDKSKQQERENDLSFENNGVVIDDTNECEGCQ